ncbi:hypothetical protein PGUG_02740 [Meyerozyma guilliermondii ATCC 6260]|uniref:Autophagy-related protein 18 n=1 Tax=Meyerozyma guilliermondii (strain ATCC 6260 / CBS 566 / DSM 6381 / JCM 1539 / NBRC 10279 / NRRL Y-324) TaxID=294746 RepID=ATG18_PICGU|nr:uncharacterized protein PGUG_02740 [Meyerozyma guilliermondii ATCC 6260]A5DHI9.2 RecName: Full=Autophagy-related protein 18 [Meyerozyma guilliermondii ATCC 6260]EDK38642.2 hypothetical protein PGUG_02740 [Meyerozyma guilliermondii ATCC 6260]
MLKSQIAPIPSYESQPVHKPSSSVNFITFNQDGSCIAVGNNKGYSIFTTNPFTKCYDSPPGEAIGIVEMLYSTSLVVVVALGEETGSSPRKLKIINTKRGSTICDLVFPSTILKVKLTRSRMIVLLEEQIYLYDISTMKLLHTIETSPNMAGICAISADQGSTDTSNSADNSGSIGSGPASGSGAGSGSASMTSTDSTPDAQSHSYLAYPSPPKTAMHDSLLVAGINTNGGSHSKQNNIQSVSNAPNRVGDVIIFDTDSLQPLCVIEAHKSALAAISLSSDGRLLATASDKGTIVRVFSVSTGAKLYQFRRGTYPTKVYSVAFSPDNRYVVTTSASGTVHIFRLGEDESLESKHKRKRASRQHETIAEETSATQDLDDEIEDDGDDSDVDDVESLEVVPSKQRKLSQGSSNSYTSMNSGISGMSEDGKEPKIDPIVDHARLSVARMIRRSSQTLGRKAAQKMGDFLPSKFASILEPTRHFASLKIASASKDVKSIAVLDSQVVHDMVPQMFLHSKDAAPASALDTQSMTEMALLHIFVVTSDGYLYVYGLDPERGGDCILLQQHSFDI